MRALIISATAVVLLLAAAPALANVSVCAPRIDAQPRCKKGCPCGNSCISCSKTCRIASPPPSKPTPAPAAVSKPATPLPVPTTAPSVSGLTSAPPSSAAWIGSSANRLFFLSTCVLAPHVPTADRIEVRDTTALSSVGFRRLILPGC